MEYISLILNFLIGSGVVSVLMFYRSKQRKENAQAALAENDVIKSFAQEWQEIAQQREQTIKDKEAKIDDLYTSLTIWRDKYNELSEKHNSIMLQKQSADYRVCNNRGCSEREPQSGF